MPWCGRGPWSAPPNRHDGAGNYSHYRYIADCNGSPTQVQLLGNWTLWFL
jgi:hypothetical protein